MSSHEDGKEHYQAEVHKWRLKELFKIIIRVGFNDDVHEKALRDHVAEGVFPFSTH